MTDEYATDRRVALDPNRIPIGWDVHYSYETTSTQAEVKRLLDQGGHSTVVAVSELQSRGRGRLDRVWSAPPFSSVLMSIGLPHRGHDSTFTLAVGTAVADALDAQGVRVRLKWPNDVVALVSGEVRKLGGILAETHGDHVVVGIGLNIDMTAAELPTPEAISCRQLGCVPNRELLIGDVVQRLLQPQPGDTMARYRRLCATLEQPVEVTRIVGEPLRGTAVAVEDDGALILRDAAGTDHRITVGDVRHVRRGLER